MARREERGDRGAAAVEFALISPMLLLLVFGIVTYGYMLSFRQAIGQGAAEGARAAAVWSTAYDASQQASRTTAAKSAVDQALQSYGVSCDVDATCSVQYVACDTGECVEVTVTYDWAADPLVPDLPLVPTPGELTQTASVRVS